MGELRKRKQIRLTDYDYTQNGYYFITICTKGKQNLFGVINSGEMILNDLGKIIDFTWNDLKNHNNIKLHQYVIMPNHLHGIIEICNIGTVFQAANYHHGIPEIIRQFKTFSSKRINKFLIRNGYKPFCAGELWQKSYYEHIIRDENDYMARVEYMFNNPLKKEQK